jgi:excisionase family DNA binding protein
MPETTPVHISIRDACARHNCSRSALYKLLGEGKVRAIKNGRRTLIIARTLDDHFAALPLAASRHPPRRRLRPLKRRSPTFRPRYKEGRDEQAAAVAY